MNELKRGDTARTNSNIFGTGYWKMVKIRRHIIYGPLPTPCSVFGCNNLIHHGDLHGSQGTKTFHVCLSHCEKAN